MVETVLDGIRLLANILLLATILNGGGFLDQTLLLLYTDRSQYFYNPCEIGTWDCISLTSLSLRSVLVEKLEKLYYGVLVTLRVEHDEPRQLRLRFTYLGGGVAVEGRLELGDRRGDLQALGKNLALALKSDVLGPLHHARKVALGLDVLADTEVAGALLEKRVLVTPN